MIFALYEVTLLSSYCYSIISQKQVGVLYRKLIPMFVTIPNTHEYRDSKEVSEE